MVRRKCSNCGNEIKGTKKTVFGHGYINFLRRPFCCYECYKEFYKDTPKHRVRPNFPTINKRGSPRSDEVKQKISEGNKGKRLGCKVSEETRLKMSAAKKGKYKLYFTGPNHPNWKGGISFEPYCPKFNDDFKERVRAFFNYQCIECGSPQQKHKLHVHHVNFNKEACCDNTEPLFVSLCPSCHSKTNHNREYWEQHFKDMITQYYGGKCYLTKDEFAYKL